MERYSVIRDKNPREIILLRGEGCFYKRCAFCDYHIDKCPDKHANYELNRSVIDRLTGLYGELEVINSGSVFELDDDTLDYLKSVCKDRGISIIHFESHYLLRDKIPALLDRFSGFTIKMKIGIETFDYDLRENVLLKGIPSHDPEDITRGFQEANFLFGITGQTVSSMMYDIRTGLDLCERICINIMCENSTSIKPDKEAIDAFVNEIYPSIKDDPRIDILLNNTDFGVGE